MQDDTQQSDPRAQNVVVVRPGERAEVPAPQEEPGEAIQHPAKVMRIAAMARQLLEEVRQAPLDEASRTRLRDIYEGSIKELAEVLSPDLRDELERLSLPFDQEAPSASELRVAHAQLVGWLEGLFHGIQTAIYAQQVAARAQLEQMRRALPMGGALPPGAQRPDGQGGAPGQPQPGPPGRGESGGMYL